MCFYSELFFLLLESITEIIFLQFFQFVTVKVVFPASVNGFSIECYSFRRVETDFFSSVFLFRANFVLAETIIQIKVKPFLIE